MKYFLSVVLTLWLGISLHAQTVIKPTIKSNSSFAIIVDNATFEAAKDEILAYRNSVEKDKLGTYIIHDDWNNPSEIRKMLKSLYFQKRGPIEGAVFIGDIPVPMIRQAQNLTSAFKMPETFAWHRSSVPSDRYYDDFDLQFEFLKQDEDEKRKNLFYYKLKADSPQYVAMDIYTGRIKPPLSTPDENAVAIIKKYLSKLVAVRNEHNQLDRMIVSKGHGYNSNSIASWTGEVGAFRSSFPKMFERDQSIQFLYYEDAEFLKYNLLTKLQDDKLDFAFMTGHGTTSLQLLNGYPNVSNPGASMKNVSRYIRSKMRSGKESDSDLEALKTRFQNSLGLNDKWFEDAFLKEKIEEDSIYNINMDINKHDVRNINARVAYLNSCFMGSFQLEDYLAGYYPFSDGKNVVAFANSVGVLQDLWGLEYLGILQHGARVGHLLKKTAYLETHIFGDPTFHFKSPDEEALNALLGTKKASKNDWEMLLNDNPDDADLQAYALNALYDYEDEKTFSPKLLEIFKITPFESVKTKAYFLLRRYENEDFHEAFVLASKDNYEYLRRLSAYDYIEVGDPKDIDDLILFYLNDLGSNRVIFKLNWALQFYDYDKVMTSLDKHLKNSSTIYHADELYEELARRIKNNRNKHQELAVLFTNGQATDKELMGGLKTLRAYRHHLLIPEVIQIVEDKTKSDEVRMTALEALSWFGLSHKRNEIVELCNSLIESQQTPEVLKTQALKTKNLIRDTGRRPF